MKRENAVGDAREPGYLPKMLQLEKTRLLFKSLKYSIAGNLVIGVLLTAFLGQSVQNTSALLMWWVAFICISLLRVFAYSGFRKALPERQHDALWLRLFSISVWLMGALWATSFWIFGMPGSLECMYLALLAIIIVSGGAITVLSYQFSLLIVFESLLFAGVVSRLLWLNDVYTAPLIGLSLLFYGFMLVGGYLVGKNFSQGMRLRMMAENNQYELQRARDEAMAASRIKGEILATLGHEIKTPVNGVLGMADLLLDSSLDTRQKHLVNAIRCSSEALLGVIDHVLDYSSIESGKLELREELFNPRQLLEDVVDMMRIPARDKQLRLTANLARSLPLQVWGDPVRLRQILVNLLGNAIRYTLQGEVSLDANVLWESDHDVAVQIAVSDTGPGISQHRQEVIFRPFEQAEDEVNDSHHGPGLGLSIVRELLQLMDSEITLDSVVDEGSRFSFVLHLRPHKRSSELPVPATHSEEVSGDAVSLEGLKVLLLERDPANRKAALAMLANLHVDVQALTNAADVMKALEDHCYHLLLLGCQMSETGGIAMVGSIRQHEQATRKPRIPIVAITPEAGRGVGSRLRAAGMDGYLAKPFDSGMLREKLLQWVDRMRCKRMKQDTVINPTVFEQLGANGPERLRNVITLYLWSAPDQLEAISTAVSDGNREKAREAIQKLKLASESLGAEKAAALCERMEAEYGKEESVMLPQLLAELQQAVDRVIAVLRKQ